MDRKERLNARDLINVGIYTALYFVIQFILAMTGFIPAMMVVMVPVNAFIGGIVLMLYYTRVKKFGMATLTGTLIGILVFLMGRPFLSLIICILSGLFADLAMKRGSYKTVSSRPVAAGLQSLWNVGMSLAMYFGYREGYMASLVEGYGQEYVDTVSRLMPDWTFFALIPVIFLFGFLGGRFGAKLLKKHFERAGIA